MSHYLALNLLVFLAAAPFVIWAGHKLRTHLDARWDTPAHVVYSGGVPAEDARNSYILLRTAIERGQPDLALRMLDAYIDGLAPHVPAKR